jgi:hypothetical protein
VALAPSLTAAAAAEQQTLSLFDAFLPSFLLPSFRACLLACLLPSFVLLRSPWKEVIESGLYQIMTGAILSFLGWLLGWA